MKNDESLEIDENEPDKQKLTNEQTLLHFSYGVFLLVPHYIVDHVAHTPFFLAQASIRVQLPTNTDPAVRGNAF